MQQGLLVFWLLSLEQHVERISDHRGRTNKVQLGRSPAFAMDGGPGTFGRLASPYGRGIFEEAYRKSFQLLQSGQFQREPILGQLRHALITAISELEVVKRWMRL